MPQDGVAFGRERSDRTLGEGAGGWTFSSASGADHRYDLAVTRDAADAGLRNEVSDC